jgi:hypothetical protein
VIIFDIADWRRGCIHLEISSHQYAGLTFYQQCDSYGVLGDGPIRATESKRGDY